MSMQGERGQEKILHANNMRIDPDKHVESYFITQAISNTEGWDKGVPMISDADASRARNWCIENKK